MQQSAKAQQVSLVGSFRELVLTVTANLTGVSSMAKTTSITSIQMVPCTEVGGAILPTDFFARRRSKVRRQLFTAPPRSATIKVRLRQLLVQMARGCPNVAPCRPMVSKVLQY